MNLYELDENITKAQSMLWVDEDGVLQGQSEMIAELDSLLLSKEDKIESLAIYYKNELAYSKAIAAEVKKLNARKKAHDSKAESLKGYLANHISAQEKIETTKIKISWKRSEGLAYSEYFNVEDLPEELQRVKREPIASDVTLRIKSGEKFEGVALVEKQNIQIK